MKNNNGVTTIEAKHIFIDIVSYTHNRSVEAQSDIISVLNNIVTNSIGDKNIDKDQYVFIPTGDGMCISLINMNMPFDIHIELAILILKKLSAHNNEENDNMRKFNLRIGINENTDNLITDINKNKNISGKGINYASRIESLCDDNQILVGDSVFDKLNQREKYMKSFTTYTAKVKHNIPLKVHQYRNKKLNFLNNEVPSEFKTIKKDTEKEDTKMTLFEAHYLATCIKNENFIIVNFDDGDKSAYSLQVLLFQLTEDTIENQKKSKTNPNPRQKVEKNKEEYFKVLETYNFWIVCDLSSYNMKKLNAISRYICDNYLFVNEDGKDKLKEEYPEIFKKANLPEMNLGNGLEIKQSVLPN